MINIRKVFCLAVLAGCDPPAVEQPPGHQGVVELEERTLAFEVAGRLREVPVQEGDAVEAGLPLARLDDTLPRLDREVRAAEARAIRAQLDLTLAGTRPEDIHSVKAEISAARTDMALAERQLARQQRLSTSGAGTAAALDEAQTAVASGKARMRTLDQQLRRLQAGARTQEVEAAQARVEAAETAVRAADERIGRHVLVADAAGVVLEVHVETGEFAAIGAPAVTLADVQRPYVDVFVPQAQVASIVLGGPATVRVDALPDALPGRIEHISRQTEFTPRFLFSPRERPNLVVRVRVRVDDPQARLHAGLPAFVTFGEEGS